MLNFLYSPHYPLFFSILAPTNQQSVQMKKYRNTINIIFSAIIVALGFGSCVSQKAYQAAKQEINDLKSENQKLREKNIELNQSIENMERAIIKYRRNMEERKVVYGPRPTSYIQKSELKEGE